MTGDNDEIAKKSIYGQEYKVPFEPYRGMDFSSCCFVFPAQSSAHRGMFRKELAEFKEFKSFFVRAGECAQSHELVAPSLYITSPGSIPGEQQSIIQTLCLFTAEFAMFRHLLNQGLKPSFITGHSFGEFAAIAASGAVDFSDMLEIVLLRETSCPPPHQLGYLISIASHYDNLPGILPSSTFEIAIRNSYCQTVIGVPTLDEAKAIENILKSSGIRHKRLANVPQPYHTSYMQQSEDRFAEKLATRRFVFRPPSCPLYSSVLQARIDRQNFSPEKILSALSKQLTRKVDFITQIEAIHNEGIYGFLEVGPGTVFLEFIKEILREKPHCIVSLAHYLAREKTVVREYNLGDNALLQRICAIISRLTGYELQKINISKKLQDDLGIDSIKKTEILFTVLEEEGIGHAATIVSSEIETVQDIGEAVLKAQAAEKLFPAHSQRIPDFQRYRFCEKERSHSTLLSRQALSYQCTVHLSLSLLIENPEKELCQGFDHLETESNPVIMLLFDCDDASPPEHASLRFLLSMQTFFSRLTRPMHLIAVAYMENFLFSAASAFFKSIAKESPHFSFTSVIVEDDKDCSFNALEASRDPYHIDLRYRAGRRYAMVMEPEEIKISDEERRDLQGSIIVAVGGAKGITFSLLDHLLSGYDITVEIVGRSARDDVAQQLETLQGRKGSITYHQGDASDYQGLLTIMETIYERHGRIDYIIHGAGHQVSAPFTMRSEDDIKTELACKVTIAQNLLRISERFNIRKIVWFSSIVSWAGNAGQAVYAFANSALNFLATTSRFRVLSILWPSWKGKGIMNDDALVRNMDTLGIALLDDTRAYQLFLDDLALPESTGLVLYHDRANTPLYWNSLTSLNDYQGITGSFVYWGEPGYQKEITIEHDPFLEDHKLKDSIYLPFSYLLALFLFQSYFLMGRVGRYKNIRLSNPISIETGAIVAFHYAIRGNSLAVSIDSIRHGHNVILSNAEGSFEYSENALADSRSIFSLSDFADYTQSLKQIAAPGLYGTHGMFHGPMYQVLREIFRDREGFYGALLPPSMIPAYTGNNNFDTVAAAIEAALQLAAVAGFEECGGFSLPVSLDSMHIDDSRSWVEPLFIKIISLQCAEACITADAAILAEDGASLAVLSGLRLRLLDGKLNR